MSDFEDTLKKVRAMRRSQQISEAERLLSTCLVDNAFDQARLLTEQSRIKRDLGKAKEAIVLLNHAIIAKDDYQAAYMDRMLISIKLKKYTNALSDAEELRNIDRNRSSQAFTATADLHAAFCYHKLGDDARAKRLLDGLETLIPETRIGGSDMSIGQLLAKLH